jgi:hypothetical protein
MVTEKYGWELESGDELLIYSKKSKRKVGEGTFDSVAVGIEYSQKSSQYYNGSIVSAFNIRHKDNSIHSYSLELYRFKLKHEIKHNDSFP